MTGPRGRLRHRLLAVIGLALLAVVVGGSAAAGSSGASSGRTPVSSGLSAAERKALEIVAVEVEGEEPAGLVVTVTFAGNIQKALGRGHLKRAAVVMILVPASADGAPAAVATEGAGPVGQIRRKTRSTEVGVQRNGKQLTFFIRGDGASAVGEIQVKTFVTKPAPSSTRPAHRPPLDLAPGTMSASQLEAYLNSTADTFKTVVGISEQVETADCATLRRLKSTSERMLRDAEQMHKKLLSTSTELRAEIGAVEAQIAIEESPYPGPIRSEIKAALAYLGLDGGVKTLSQYLATLRKAKRLATEADERNDYMLKVIQNLDDDLAREIEIRCTIPGLSVRIDSAGYDHTTPGSTPSTLPSTVCANFLANVPGARRWQAELSGPRSASADGPLAEGGEGRVVFGIPQGGTYHLKITVSAGGGRIVIAETDIKVPDPPPYSTSKDCKGPPSPS